MKAFFRHPAVQRALALTLAGYLKFVYATLRWTHEGQEHADGVWARKGETGAIMAFWHMGIPLSPCAWDLTRNPQELHGLISRSADGEFIAEAWKALGYPAIRGGRRNPNAIEDKGGAEAFRQMIRWLKGGGAIGLTPDGPKGPARVMGDGPPTLARLTGVPVLLVGVACKPCIRVKSWDRTILPLPFARAAQVWAPPVYASREDDAAELARDWEEKLNAVSDRAQALLEE